MSDISKTVLVGQLAKKMRTRKGTTTFFVLLGCLAVVDYLWTLRDLIFGGYLEGYAVLGIAVLLGTVVLVRDRWPKVRNMPAEPSTWGLLLIAFSLLALFVGTRAGLVFVTGRMSVFLRGVSLVAFLCGGVVLLLGWRAMRELWVPALLLLFVYPENALTMYWVPLHLQTLASVLSAKAVAFVGLPVVRQGNVLQTAAIAANVEEACSGIRSLQTVVPAAIFISAYGLTKFRSRVVLIVLSVPVVVLANVVRIVVTVLVATYVSTAAAQGFFHFFEGLGMFVFCLVFLLVFWQGLQQLERAGNKNAMSPGTRHPPSGDHRASCRPGWPALGTGTGIVVLCILLVGIVYQSVELWHVRAAEMHHRAPPLAMIPRQLGKWTGADLPDLWGTDRDREVSDALSRVYRSPGEPDITVTLLYWRAGEGSYLGRRGHLPEGCYPAHGMADLWSETKQLQTTSSVVPVVSVRTSAFSAPTGNIIVTSWQQAGLSSAPVSRAPVYSGIGSELLYGLREIVKVGNEYPAEMALQLSTSEDGPLDRIKSAQTRFASLFIASACDTVLAPAVEAESPRQALPPPIASRR